VGRKRLSRKSLSLFLCCLEFLDGDQAEQKSFYSIHCIFNPFCWRLQQDRLLSSRVKPFSLVLKWLIDANGKKPLKPYLLQELAIMFCIAFFLQIMGQTLALVFHPNSKPFLMLHPVWGGG